jgi:hypothetical protein
VFGNGGRRRERKLRQHGKPAMATVLSARRKMSGLCKSDDPFYQSQPTQVTPSLRTVTVRVEPDGVPAFEAQIKAWLFDTQRPMQNTVVPVLYDPSDHRTAVLVTSPEAQNAARQAIIEMRDRWLEEQAGNPVDRLTELMETRELLGQ